MANNALVVEQAPTLATPSTHEANNDHDGIIDLDAGTEDSLLDSSPDDGRDIGSHDDEPSKEVPATQEAEPEKDDEPEVEDGEEDHDDEETELAALRGEPEKPGKLSGSARLKAKLAEAQAEIERLRQAVPKVEESKALADAVEREIGPAPKEADYPDYLQFSKAETAYETMKMMVSRELKKNAERAKVETELRNNTIVETFKDRANDVRKFVKDFDKVTQSASVSPSHPSTITLILESDKGPQLAYYLAKHPDKVHELNDMPIHRQHAEIGRLESRLSKPEPKKISKAPAPVAPVTNPAPAMEKKDLTADQVEKLSPGEFKKWFAARKAARE
jgi:hypothetical protein